MTINHKTCSFHVKIICLFFFFYRFRLNILHFLLICFNESFCNESSGLLQIKQNNTLGLYFSCSVQAREKKKKFAAGPVKRNKVNLFFIQKFYIFFFYLSAFCLLFNLLKKKKCNKFFFVTFDGTKNVSDQMKPRIFFFLNPVLTSLHLPDTYLPSGRRAEN